MAIEASGVAQGISVALTIGVSQAVPIAVPQAVPIVAIEGVSIGIGDRLGLSNSSGVSLCLSFSLGGKMLPNNLLVQTITFDKYSLEKAEDLVVVVSSAWAVVLSVIAVIAGPVPATLKNLA